MPADFPAIPPDGTPLAVRDEFSRPENLVHLDHTGSAVRNVLEVWFLDSIPTQSRAEAIRAVKGEVIGGRRLPLGHGGIYVIRFPVPKDSLTYGPLMQVYNRLRAMPQVHSVSLELVGAFVTPAGGPPPISTIELRR